MEPRLRNKLLAEGLGTGWLVFGGCGAAVLAANAQSGPIGALGVAFAFGFAVMTAFAAFGHISGGHFNPAVTVGLALARRFKWNHVPGYIAAQVLGAIGGTAVLFAIANGLTGFTVADGFAANGYGGLSPSGYSLTAAAVAEVFLTFMFVMVLLGATDARARASVAALAIGLALAVVHLISIPVTNGSVNPARSTAPALFAGPAAIGQLWLFWLAPMVGGAIAGAVYPAFAREGALIRARERAQERERERAEAAQHRHMH